LLCRRASANRRCCVAGRQLTGDVFVVHGKNQSQSKCRKMRSSFMARFCLIFFVDPRRLTHSRLSFEVFFFDAKLFAFQQNSRGVPLSYRTSLLFVREGCGGESNFSKFFRAGFSPLRSISPPLKLEVLRKRGVLGGKKLRRNLRLKTNRAIK